MSWQATSWAIKQKTGSPARKVLLLAMANYADEYGRCWPSQATLADNTEQSIDTVQRQSRRLERGGHIKIEKRARICGRWPGHVYQLAMPGRNMRPAEHAVQYSSGNLERPIGVDEYGLNAAKKGPQQARSPGRTIVRHEQSKNHHFEPSLRRGRSSQDERPQAVKRTRAEIQRIEREIVSIIGNGNDAEGWLKWGNLNGWQRQALVEMHACGTLNAADIACIVQAGGGYEKGF
jgi:Helix-turn-helix domain